MIGILGGMGPRSTSPFLERVLDACAARYGALCDADFPPMMIHSLPTPFTLAGPLNHDEMGRSIRRGLERLVATGVAVVAIPCNVAHLYFDEITRGISVPVLHLIDLAAAAVPATVDMAMIVATRPTVDSGLYQTSLRSRGIPFRDPTPWQDEIDGIIAGVKASWPQEKLAQAWHQMVGSVAEAGVDCVVLGSTDLSAVRAISGEERLRVVDGGAVLAAELVERWTALL